MDRRTFFRKAAPVAALGLLPIAAVSFMAATRAERKPLPNWESPVGIKEWDALIDRVNELSKQND